MPRYQRKTDHGVTDYEALANALKAIKMKNKSLRSTAAAFSIPKSSLARYIKKFDEHGENIAEMSDDELDVLVRKIASYTTHPMIFSWDEEIALLEYLKQHDNGSKNITNQRRLAYQFAKKIQITYPTGWDRKEMAGKDWYYSLMRRHSTFETVLVGPESEFKGYDEATTSMGQNLSETIVHLSIPEVKTEPNYQHEEEEKEEEDPLGGASALEASAPSTHESEMKPATSVNILETHSGCLNRNQYPVAVLGNILKKSKTTRAPQFKRPKVEKDLKLGIKQEVVEQDDYEYF